MSSKYTKIKKKLKKENFKKLEERIKTVLFATGVKKNPEPQIIKESIIFLYDLVKLIFNKKFVTKIKENEKNSLRENKIILDYFSLIFPEEFYIFCDRFKKQDYFKKQRSKINPKFNRTKFYHFFIKKKLMYLKKLKILIRVQKLEKSEYYEKRTELVNGDDLTYLEKCKEKTLFKFRDIKKVYNFITKFSDLEINFLKHNKFMIKFVNYLLTMILKQISENLIKEKISTSKKKKITYNFTLLVKNLKKKFLIKKKNLKKKINNFFFISDERFSQIVYHNFKREYDDYLDIIFLQEDKFLKINLHKREKNPLMMKSLKKFSEELTFERKESINELKEIEKDRLILDYIDNPKLLWNHLKIFVRNLFFERFVIEKQILNLYLNDKNLSLKKCVEEISDCNRNSKFAILVKEKLLNNEKTDFHLLPNFKMHFKKIIKEIFISFLIQQLADYKEDDKVLEIENLKNVKDDTKFSFPTKKLKNLNNFFD